jgi:hypothetical protein
MLIMTNISSTPGYPSDYLANEGEKPKIVPVNLLFGPTLPAQPSWLFDYSNNQQQSYMKTLQGLWIDNFDNTTVVTINVQGNSTQRIVAPANSQGYYTILVSGAIRLTLSSAGTATVPVYFSNQPFSNHIWNPIGAGVASSVTIAGPNPLPVAVTTFAPNPLPVSVATPINTYYGISQSAMTGSAIQLSTILPSGAPTSLKNLTLQGAAANTTNIIDLGSSAGVTVGTGIEIAAGGFKNLALIDTTKMYVIGASGTKLNIEAIN